MTGNSRPFSSRFVSSLGLQNSRISKNAYKLKIKESKIGVFGRAGGGGASLNEKRTESFEINSNRSSEKKSNLPVS